MTLKRFNIEACDSCVILEEILNPKGALMDANEVIKALKNIADDARNCAECSHEDVLKDSLKDIEKQIKDLINDKSN